MKLDRMTSIRSAMTTVSLILCLLSVVFISTKGFNWGLDFTGGVVAEVELEQQLSAESIKAYLDHQLQQDVQVIATQDGRWLLRFGVDAANDSPSLQQSIATFSPQYSIISSSFIGPQVGQDMVEQGGLAVLACFVLILVYLSMRFDWRLALGSIGALVHDVLLVLGLFACLQLEFNLTILAAVLAIMGYSLNDSIIISDRIREVFRGKPDGEVNPLLDQSVRSTFSRTIVTSGTTLVTVSALWLLGGPVLEGFAIALCVGIASGTWSSISIGTTLPTLLGLQPQHYQVKPIDDALSNAP
ncbi:protein translocase subunit SecF [Shewanella sp. Scap07]|uniref:protein translocase subunit SecF n=1 Tax=Shewanella sp. Scap07 TaxID=2589987 RepID=UPI001C4B9F24|nr:protein translocase subunit SecF [Shewanella sp. Scap07]